MAVVPRHGKTSDVLIDEMEMTRFLQTATVSASMDAPEKTTFGKNDREFIAGLRQATVACDGIFSATTGSSMAADNVADYLDAALGGSTKLVVTVGIDGGASTGNRAYLLTGDAIKLDYSAPFDDIVKIAADIQASGGYQAGRWLVGPTTSTATANGGAVAAAGTTAAGGSTGGGVGHLHVLAERNVVSAVFKAQHSTSGSTWADLITFTSATGRTFQRSTVSGTIKERVRGALTTLTEGATGGSITWAMALARNGSPKK